MTDIVTETNNGAALSVRNLVKQYANADRRVLDDVSFDVPKGRVLVVVGPSGSGKSTNCARILAWCSKATICSRTKPYLATS